MITTVCLNPCVDRTVWIQGFVRGGMNRVLREESHPSGKGVNTAHTLAMLGHPVQLVALVGREDAEKLSATAAQSGYRARCVLTEGALRVNVKVFDMSRDEITEINAPGVPATAQSLAEAMDVILQCAKESQWLALSGSLPPGCPPDFYAQVIAQTHAHAPGCRVALDAEGESFRLGLRAEPDLVKPNQHELSVFLGRQVRSRAETTDGARALQAAGAKTVIVSMGTEGALLCPPEGACAYAPAIQVPVLTTCGAGDAMLSGYIGARALGLDRPEAFRHGVAAATATVAGDVSRAEAFLPQVTFTP